jgi:hypothetical protein
VIVAYPENALGDDNPSMPETFAGPVRRNHELAPQVNVEVPRRLKRQSGLKPEKTWKGEPFGRVREVGPIDVDVSEEAVGGEVVLKSTVDARRIPRFGVSRNIITRLDALVRVEEENPEVRDIRITRGYPLDQSGSFLGFASPRRSNSPRDDLAPVFDSLEIFFRRPDPWVLAFKEELPCSIASDDGPAERFDGIEGAFEKVDVVKERNTNDDVQ